MEIFYVGACFGLTILTSVGVFVVLVVRRDRRRNAVWAGQWAARLEERLEREQRAELENAWPSELPAELPAGGAR